jgi:hypothetical protein
MNNIPAAFLDLVAGRRGHFWLESGHHSSLWLDLDPLFAEPHRVNPFVAELTTALRPYELLPCAGRCLVVPFSRSSSPRRSALSFASQSA